MPKIQDDPANLRDKAFAYEAFGDMESAVRCWQAAITAASQQVGTSGAVDVGWLRRRLLYAQSVLDLVADRREKVFN